MSMVDDSFETNWAQLHRKTRRRPLIWLPAASSSADGLRVRPKPSEQWGLIAVSLLFGAMFTGFSLFVPDLVTRVSLLLFGLFVPLVALRLLLFPASVSWSSGSDELRIQYGFFLFPRRVTLNRQRLSAAYNIGAETTLPRGWRGFKIVSLRRLDNGEQAFIGYNLKSDDAKGVFQHLASIVGGKSLDHTQAAVSLPDGTSISVGTLATWDAGKWHRYESQISFPMPKVAEIRRKIFRGDRHIKSPVPAEYPVRIERQRERLHVAWSDGRKRDFPLSECFGIQVCREYTAQRRSTRYELNLILARTEDNRVNLVSLDLSPHEESVAPRGMAEQLGACLDLSVLDHLTPGGESLAASTLPFGTARQDTGGSAGLTPNSDSSHTSWLPPAGCLATAIAVGILAIIGGVMFFSGVGDDSVEVELDKAASAEGKSTEVVSTDVAPAKPVDEPSKPRPTIAKPAKLSVTQIREFSGHTNAIESVVFSSDGKRFLTGSFDRTIRMWDVESGEPIHIYSGHESLVCSLSAAPNNEVFASGAGDGTARVWRLDGAEEVRRFGGHEGSVHVAFLPDSRRLLTGSTDGIVRLWDTDTGDQLKRFDAGEPIWCIDAAPDKPTALIGSSKGTVLLWDYEKDKEIWRLTRQTSVMDMDFSSDGRHAAFSHWSRRVSLLDMETHKVLHVFQGHDSAVNSVNFSPDGRLLVSSCGADNTIRVWDVASRDEVARHVAANHFTKHSALSPDGKSIVSGGGYYFDSEAKQFKYDDDYAIRLWRLMPVENSTASGDPP